MRARAAVSALLLSAAVVTACASAPEMDDEDTATTSQALARRGVLLETAPPRIKDPPPPPPPSPDAGPTRPPLGSIGTLSDAVLVEANATTCEKKRIDLRRKTRTCEDLPGAYSVNGETFVPGTGGRFRVTRMLAGTSAPASLQDRSCIYTWEPDGCAAVDTAKLLVEAEEDPASRDSCLTNPALCRVVSKVPSTKLPSVIPNGPGRCEVCGYATNSTMWVILPPEWLGFSYQLAGEMTQRHVFLEPTDAASVVEVDLGQTVTDQDVSIQLAIE